MKNNRILLFIVCLLPVISSCNFLFGNKKDKQVDDIFKQGKIDPHLVNNQVGYVPIQPIWNNFSSPTDVYVGFDEMIYVTDANGLHVLDQKGQEHRLIAISNPSDVVQDRSLRTYVCGRIYKDVTGDGVPENLAAVYILQNTSSASGVIFLDTLIHPFCDATRNTSTFRGASDEEVYFSGVAPLADNRYYVARKGPTNSLTSIALPDNAVMIFNHSNRNVGYANGLNPLYSSLKSLLSVSGICTAVAPPQSYENSNNNFFVTQQDAKAEYKVLSIKETNDVDAGITYTEDAFFLNQDKSKANHFLYESFRFNKPSDVYKSPDALGYIFVVDEGNDSLYQFSSKGYEGVNPPANSTETKQIIASFGGSGNGPFQFNSPSGVCYFRNVVYVADKGNNRICRFKLSTDLER